MGCGDAARTDSRWSAQRVYQSAQGCDAWYVENPVGALSRLWRKPDHVFDPCEYGGYLSESDEHPLYPQHIPARDAYRKKTCIWHGLGRFTMPPRRPASQSVSQWSPCRSFVLASARAGPVATRHKPPDSVGGRSGPRISGRRRRVGGQGRCLRPILLYGRAKPPCEFRVKTA